MEKGKEEAREHMEKRSEAGDEEGTSHMEHNPRKFKHCFRRKKTYQYVFFTITTVTVGIDS